MQANLTPARPPVIARFMDIPSNTPASPAMQNAGIAALGLNWHLAFDVQPHDLAGTAQKSWDLSGRSYPAAQSPRGPNRGCLMTPRNAGAR
jgi:hypothetical protein